MVVFSLPNYNLWQWVICLCRIAFAGHRPDFILPDRKKYVSMDKQYLKNYMDLVIKVKSNLACARGNSRSSLLALHTRVFIYLAWFLLVRLFMQTNSRASLKSSFVGNWNINSLSRVVYIMIRIVSRLVRKSLSTALDTTLHFSCRKIHCVGKKNGLLQSRTMPFWFCFFRHVTRGAVTPRVEWRQLCYQRIIRSSGNKSLLMFAGNSVH